MKKVLAAIGQFFVRIGRWIKDTAWIQPLLIVGVIFAIIFSIPSIVSGFEKISERRNSAHTYYKKFLVSLKGTQSSAAQDLFDKIYNTENDADGVKLGDKDPKKFFIVFISEDCPYCGDAKEGFEELSKYKADQFKGAKFALKTVDIKEDTDEDWKSENPSAKSAFEAFLDRNILYFEGFASAAQESNYYINGKITDQQITDRIESADASKFATPTFMLVDFTEGNNGVTSVFFGVEGDTAAKKAAYLLSAWNYTGDFAPTN